MLSILAHNIMAGRAGLGYNTDAMRRTSFLFTATLILLTAAGLRTLALADIPPGLHFDEAANGVITRGIAYSGQRPLFIAAYTGKEVLWFYWAALVARIAGPTVFALRLASAWMGLLTVAAGGWAVRQLYTHDDRRDWLALLTMAVLAIAFWHLVLSRLAFRAISQPLMQAIAIGILFGGWRRSDWRWMVAAGIATGLAGYTYLAARLFPIPLAVGWIVFLLSRSGNASRVGSRTHPTKTASLEKINLVSPRIRHMMLYGIAAMLTFAPLGLYFLRNPGGVHDARRAGCAINMGRGVGRVAIGVGDVLPRR